MEQIYECGSNTMRYEVDIYNKRAKLESYGGSLLAALNKIMELSNEKKLEKVIVKGQKEDQITLISQGFTTEAVILHYFGRNEHAFLAAKYLSENRRSTNSWIEEDNLLEKVFQKSSTSINRESGFSIRRANVHDAIKMSEFYCKVFDVYPTPIFQPQYIQKTMTHTVYYLAEHSGKIISAASADINGARDSAELTDCATLPEYRGYQLMQQLLLRLEQELVKKKIYCAYSIARAQSFGMNSVLHQLQYQYTGRLTNNCYIHKDLENMNVWCKLLS
ncbi:putative beta-lysine N-acetyltransferase [Bacillus lacus]|uniref:Putative beta-lysine N-acetyltransferase n=1 Tax=Metabacillus lacus TaxID=1983721 RepID=A0A7X2IZX0_9BACI|nr:putative beta-lysine N-acetyltransferase [Metabacillus lacus]MRX72885.1 putative beta-lysine N-acetyltransferase [Metabacillus lacus]